MVATFCHINAYLPWVGRSVRVLQWPWIFSSNSNTGSRELRQLLLTELASSSIQCPHVSHKHGEWFTVPSLLLLPQQTTRTWESTYNNRFIKYTLDRHLLECGSSTIGSVLSSSATGVYTAVITTHLNTHVVSSDSCCCCSPVATSSYISVCVVSPPW